MTTQCEGRESYKPMWRSMALSLFVFVNARYVTVYKCLCRDFLTNPRNSTSIIKLSPFVDVNAKYVMLSQYPWCLMCKRLGLEPQKLYIRQSTVAFRAEYEAVRKHLYNIFFTATEPPKLCFWCMRVRYLIVLHKWVFGKRPTHRPASSLSEMIL